MSKLCSNENIQLQKEKPLLYSGLLCPTVTPRSPNLIDIPLDWQLANFYFPYTKVDLRLEVTAEEEACRV